MLDGRKEVPAMGEVSVATRHVMQANKSKNTKPELLVRQALRAGGLPGYRLHWKKCAGRPDVCYPGRKVAIFVNGCFWHRCPHCNLPMPKSNVAFWEAKFERNRARDKRTYEALVSGGWTVLVVWECALKRGRFDSTIARLIREVELATVGLLPAGRKVEVGYQKPWQRRTAWRRWHP
ncbi:MAG: very short patch repair endonuclease [Atopobiaceae bacterium]|nr:very short patch repair endonuclease [Atopobiaceae bacterium]